MRLRQLRKLEEMELNKERAALAKEREQLDRLLKSTKKQWERLTKDLSALKDKFGDPRRTEVRPVAGSVRAEIDWTQMIEREPITVILSERGWIRGMKGHGRPAHRGHIGRENGNSGGSANDPLQCVAMARR